DLGWIHALLGRADEAVPHVEMALAHWRGTGDRRGEAMTMRVLARALSELGRDDEALEYAHVALATFRDLRIREAATDCLVAIGLQYARLGRLDEAIAAHDEGIEIAERYGDLWHMGVLVGNVAELHRRAGDFCEAVAQ